MSSPGARIYFTEEEYLAIERASDERHEYLDGRIFAMAGESPNHNTICVNLVRELSTHLKDTGCWTHMQNVKVRTGPEPKAGQRSKGFYSYPDVLVVCGERLYHDRLRDVLLNPNVIFEVLSKSTERTDRGEKFQRYRTWLPSFTDYVLVSQTETVVEHYRRQPNGEWLLTTISGRDAVLVIASIGCEIKLSEIYDSVVLTEDTDDDGGGRE